MGSYYKDKRAAALELQNWILNQDRPSWSSFCRDIRLERGFSPKQMLRLLEEDYPKLTIIDDVLRKKVEETE